MPERRIRRNPAVASPRCWRTRAMYSAAATMDPQHRRVLPAVSVPWVTQKEKAPPERGFMQRPL